MSDGNADYSDVNHEDKADYEGVNELDRVIETLGENRVEDIMRECGSPPLPTLGTWQNSHHIDYWLKQVTSLLTEISKDVPVWHGIPLRSLASRLDRARHMLSDPVPYPTETPDAEGAHKEWRAKDKRRIAHVPKTVYSDEDRVLLLRYLVEQRAEGMSFSAIARNLNNQEIFAAGNRKNWSALRLGKWYRSAVDMYFEDIAPDLELLREHLQHPEAIARNAVRKAVSRSRRDIIRRHKKKLKLKTPRMRMTDWQRRWSRNRRNYAYMRKCRGATLERLRKKGLPLNERWRRDNVRLSALHDLIVRRGPVIKAGAPSFSSFRSWMRGTRGGWKDVHLVAMAECATLLSYSGTVYTSLEVGAFLRTVRIKPKTSLEFTHTPEQVLKRIRLCRSLGLSYYMIAKKLNEDAVSVRFGNRVLRVWRGVRVKELYLEGEKQKEQKEQKAHEKQKEHEKQKGHEKQKAQKEQKEHEKQKSSGVSAADTQNYSSVPQNNSDAITDSTSTVASSSPSVRLNVPPDAPPPF